MAIIRRRIDSDEGARVAPSVSRQTAECPRSYEVDKPAPGRSFHPPTSSSPETLHMTRLFLSHTAQRCVCGGGRSRRSHGALAKNGTIYLPPFPSSRVCVCVFTYLGRCATHNASSRTCQHAWSRAKDGKAAGFPAGFWQVVQLSSSAQSCLPCLSMMGGEREREGRKR